MAISDEEGKCQKNHHSQENEIVPTVLIEMEELVEALWKPQQETHYHEEGWCVDVAEIETVTTEKEPDKTNEEYDTAYHIQIIQRLLHHSKCLIFYYVYLYLVFTIS